MNFKYVGKNVRLSSLASFDKPQLMSFGDYSRVDDFCALSGPITIGRNVHVAVMCSIVASKESITLSDFSGLAFGCRLFSSSDDYSGETMTNPTVPIDYKKITHGQIVLGRHVIVGTNSIVFPGVEIAEGCAVGANSLIAKSTQPWGIYVGSPARRIRERSQSLLGFEETFLNGGPK
jgi:galactoside O-acetyltransferase